MSHLLSYVAAVDCPEHPGQHNAVMYQTGHNNAGFFDCPTGVSGECPHENLEVEMFTVDTMGFNGHDQYEVPGWVCQDCDCPVDGYEPEEPDEY